MKRQRGSLPGIPLEILLNKTLFLETIKTMRKLYPVDSLTSRRLAFNWRDEVTT